MVALVETSGAPPVVPCRWVSVCCTPSIQSWSWVALPSTNTAVTRCQLLANPALLIP